MGVFFSGAQPQGGLGDASPPGFFFYTFNANFTPRCANSPRAFAPEMQGKFVTNDKSDFPAGVCDWNFKIFSRLADCSALDENWGVCVWGTQSPVASVENSGLMICSLCTHMLDYYWFDDLVLLDLNAAIRNNWLLVACSHRQFYILKNELSKNLDVYIAGSLQVVL